MITWVIYIYVKFKRRIQNNLCGLFTCITDLNGWVFMQMHKCVNGWLAGSSKLPPRRTNLLAPSAPAPAPKHCLHWLRISSPWRGTACLSGQELAGQAECWKCCYKVITCIRTKLTPVGSAWTERCRWFFQQRTTRELFRRVFLETEPVENWNISDFSNSSAKWCLWCCESKFLDTYHCLKRSKLGSIYPRYMWGYHNAACSHAVQELETRLPGWK